MTRVYDHSFAEMQTYLSDRFEVDFTGPTDRFGERWGPPFLQTNTLYWVNRTQYVPDTALKVKAWFYQIGGEQITLSLREKDDARSTLYVDYIGRPFCCFVPFAFTHQFERSIHKRIRDDIATNGVRRQERPQQPPERDK